MPGMARKGCYVRKLKTDKTVNLSRRGKRPELDSRAKAYHTAPSH
jgi:hypothetical protein